MNTHMSLITKNNVMMRLENRALMIFATITCVACWIVCYTRYMGTSQTISTLGYTANKIPLTTKLSLFDVESMCHNIECVEINTHNETYKIGLRPWVSPYSALYGSVMKSISTFIELICGS